MVKSYLSRHQAAEPWDFREIYDNAKRAYHETGKRVIMIDIDMLTSWADKEWATQLGEKLYGEN